MIPEADGAGHRGAGRVGAGFAEVRSRGVAGCGRTLIAVHICFVCSGNICRSPSAALVFGEHVRRAGLDGVVRITSAGTGPGMSANPSTSGPVRLARRGYPVEHVAAQVGADHLGADLLLAMDSGHAETLRRLTGDPSGSG
ncbi:hypothetical protein NKH77_08740 [Streptomyces sp. M19]